MPWRSVRCFYFMLGSVCLPPGLVQIWGDWCKSLWRFYMVNASRLACCHGLHTDRYIPRVCLVRFSDHWRLTDDWSVLTSLQSIAAGQIRCTSHLEISLKFARSVTHYSHQSAKKNGRRMHPSLLTPCNTTTLIPHINFHPPIVCTSSAFHHLSPG